MNCKRSANMPTISIVTPSYNQGEFIARTIESVVTQKGIGRTFALEYIIIDGESTDSSVSIIKKYANDYSFIEWISEKDEGQSDAINKGLRRASGDICGWINSDDELSPRALLHLIELSDKNRDARWFIGNCVFIDENGMECFKWITAYKQFWLRRYSYDRLLVEDFISQPSTFWRRDLFFDVGLLDIQDHTIMDYDLWLRMGRKSDPVVTLRTLSRHRRYKDSKSGSLYSKQAQHSLLAAKKYTSKSSILVQNRLNGLARVCMYKLVDFLFW